MAKFKVTITGIPEKEPKIYENGNVDLIFKMEPTTAVPKGLEPLNTCACLVHIAPKTWKKVQDTFQPESKLLVQGEVKASVNKKGMAFLEVVAMDIGLIEPREQSEGEQASKREQPAPVPEPKKPALKLSTVIKGTEKFVELAKIGIPEGWTPPEPSSVKGAVAYIQAHKTLSKPILLSLSNVLVDGYASYLAAQELGIEKVPVAYEKPIASPNEVRIGESAPNKKSDKKPERPIPPRETWGSMLLSDIQIPEALLRTPPRPQKVQEIMKYIQTNQRFDKPITIDTAKQLLDGYSRYVAAQELQFETVPVIVEEKVESEGEDA